MSTAVKSYPIQEAEAHFYIAKAYFHEGQGRSSEAHEALLEAEKIFAYARQLQTRIDGAVKGRVFAREYGDDHSDYFTPEDNKDAELPRSKYAVLPTDKKQYDRFKKMHGQVVLIIPEVQS